MSGIPDPRDQHYNDIDISPHHQSKERLEKKNQNNFFFNFKLFYLLKNPNVKNGWFEEEHEAELKRVEDTIL